MIDVFVNSGFKFMRHRLYAAVFSLILIAVSIASIAIRGFNFGVDFTGGTIVEIGYPQTADLEAIRAALETDETPSVDVQHFGTPQDVLIRFGPSETENQAELSSRVVDRLRAVNPELTVRRVEFVGPQVGEELRENGGLAVLYALFGILIYVAFRFEYRFALGSIIALIHDVVLTLGFFSLVGLEFDLSVLAAVLAVIGYSLNDTIVIFDRIRENFLASKRPKTESVIDQAINQTLGRTIITGVTTLLVLSALLIFGGAAIQSFTVAMIAGIIFGTYSSVYTAGSSLMFFKLRPEHMIVEKEA